MDEENKTQVEYNPEIFKNKHGQFDFSKAENYNEELVRSNINHVKRDHSAIVIAPT